jgi:hypothetical protein
MKTLHLILVFTLIIHFSNAQTSIDYFGQTPPGNSAKVFAPDKISLNNRLETKIAISPDGNEYYISTWQFNATSSVSKIYYTKRINNEWTEQAETSFSLGKNAAYPFLSADRNTLFFDYLDATWDTIHIWKVERTTGGWGAPQLLPSPINQNARDYNYTETVNGVAYISSVRPFGIGIDDNIWRIVSLPDQSKKAERLEPSINNNSANNCPCIAPDGSYLIFSRRKIINGEDFQDLNICFNNGGNNWTEPINMERCGTKINVSHQVFPSLSPDGKYLFFARHTHNLDSMDIYWVSTYIIDTLKNIAKQTSVNLPGKEHEINVFPNPTTGIVNIETAAPCEITVTDPSGKELLKLNSNDLHTSLNLSGFGKGMYMVHAKTDNESVTKKIMVK